MIQDSHAVQMLMNYIPLLLKGTMITVAVAVVSLVLATVLGGLCAAARLSGWRGLQIIAHIYCTLMRGMPDLVLILLIYFGGQRSINAILRALGGDTLDISKFWAGVIAIGVLYGAYLCETFRGAYQNVPKGQREAALALGLSRWRVLWMVEMPQILRLALPGYANVWQVLVKSTAVVSVIGLEDLVGLADKIGKSTNEPFLFMAVVLGVYLGLTALSNWGVRCVETRLSRGYTG